MTAPAGPGPRPLGAPPARRVAGWRCGLTGLGRHTARVLTPWSLKQCGCSCGGPESWAADGVLMSRYPSPVSGAGPGKETDARLVETRRQTPALWKHGTAARCDSDRERARDQGKQQDSDREGDSDREEAGCVTGRNGEGRERWKTRAGGWSIEKAGGWSIEGVEYRKGRPMEYRRQADGVSKRQADGVSKAGRWSIEKAGRWSIEGRPMAY